MVLEKILFLSEGFNEKKLFPVLDSFESSEKFLISGFSKSQMDQFQRFGVKTYTYKELENLSKQYTIDEIVVFGWFLLKTFFSDIKRYFGKAKIIMILEQIDYKANSEPEIKKNEQLYFYGLADQIVVFSIDDFEETEKHHDKVSLFEMVSEIKRE